jgi:flagellar M-ring protein FliF
MNFFQKIKTILQNVSLVQRALLIAVVLTFVIVAVLLAHWARKPDMRMLYFDLAPEEAAKITEIIIEKGIAYKLRNGGTSVYVPKEKVYQLRLDMAKEGLPADAQGGYRIFDNEKIGVSPFRQKVNLQRALQEELAKSIQMIEGVVRARVHIVDSKQELFTAEGKERSASVVLRLRPGYRLTAVNIASITHLVAGSVQGLKPESVTLVDSQGRLLSRESDQMLDNGAGTVQDYRERVEHNLAAKVEDMLATVLGPGRATVRVSAVIDMTSGSLVTETYDQSKKVPKKEEIKTVSEEKGATAGSEGEAVIPGGTKMDETISTEYAVPKIVEQKVDLPGDVISLSVAAVVDLTPADANEAATGAETAKIMQLPDVEELIRNALGLKETDPLKVVEARFHRPIESQIEEAPSKWPRYMAIARQASLGITAVCAMLVLWVFRGAKKKASSVAVAGQLAGTEEAAGLLPAGAENAEPLALRRQITTALESNPAQVKQLFASWLEQKE